MVGTSPNNLPDEIGGAVLKVGGGEANECSRLLDICTTLADGLGICEEGGGVRSTEAGGGVERY